MGRSHWHAADDEQRFRDDLQLGDRWVRRVASTLGAYLPKVRVPEVQVRPTFEDRQAFRDTGDIFVNGHRIEVRSLGFAFYGVKDYPRPQVLVELVSAKAKLADTMAILFISRQTGSVVALYGPVLKRLGTRTGVWDNRRRCSRDWLVCKRDDLQDWGSAITYLQERCRDARDCRS